jgi:hypothetical protein
MRQQFHQQPAMGNLPSVMSIPLSEGDVGTEETIAYVRQAVDQSVKDPLVNRTAIAILHAAHIRAYDFAGEVRAIFDWVLRNIRFTRDIRGKETVRTARETLTVRAGDCDCINAVLIPSLLQTIGHTVRLVTISAHPVSPNFSHIYAEVLLNGRWIPVDAARRDAAFGRGPTRYSRKRIWALNSDDFEDVQGLRVPQCELGYYAAARGMGDWSDFFDPSLLNSITSGAANIIKSLNTPGLPSFVISPSGQPLPGQNQQQQNFALPSQMPSWLIPAGLLIGAVALLGRH